MALDDSVPRILRIAGDSVSAQGIADMLSAVTGRPYRTLWAGTVGTLGVMIRLAKLLTPQPTAVFPPWQGMQYLRDMFSGRGKLDLLDVDRYSGIVATSLRDFIARSSIAW